MYANMVFHDDISWCIFIRIKIAATLLVQFVILRYRVFVIKQNIVVINIIARTVFRGNICSFISK